MIESTARTGRTGRTERTERTAAPPLHVRPFAAADIAEVGRLHLKVFPQAPGESFRTPKAYAEYLQSVFLDGPEKDDADRLSSLVCVQGGAIIGFLGVVSVRMALKGAPLLAACCTQFVVDPNRRGLAGLMLMRNFLSGPQALSFSDECGAIAIKVWEWSGGALLTLSSLHFARPLRPAAFALDVLRRRRGLALLSTLALPLAWLVDVIASRIPSSPFGRSKDSTTSEALAADAMGDALPTLLAARPLVPDYRDGPALRWRLARAGGYAKRGPLRRALVRNDAGETIGWYVAYFPRNEIGEVLQVVADEANIGAVLGRLFHDARRGGVIGLRGRLDPALVQGYSDAHCLISRRGPLMLAHARDRAVMDLLHRGQAFVSRLEGEWYARFE